jgi:hypothetical protein
VTANIQELFGPYADEAQRLARAASTTAESYYPAIKGLLTRVLEFLQLPFEVRTNTSESRAERGHDLPDFSFYDGPGEFLVVCGEAERPNEEIRDVSFSKERNNQIGRYSDLVSQAGRRLKVVWLWLSRIRNILRLGSF